MNKKVSTLLTAGLLMMGPVFGSVFAQEIATSATPITEIDFKDGRYVLESSYFYNGSSVGNKGYQTFVTPVKDGDNWSFRLTSDKNSKKVIWTVKKHTNTSGAEEYTFTSTYGQLTVNYKENDENKSQAVFQLKDESAYVGVSTAFSLTWGTNYIGAEAIAEKPGEWNLVPTNGSTSNKPNYFQLYKVIDDDQTAGDLNELYNKKGFNFTAGKDVKENLFEGSSRIIAVDVDADGHNWATSTDNGKDLIIPAGTYFFTDLVLKKGATPEADGTYKPENINWDESTIIYASATETVEGTVNNRNEGQGFILKTAKVSDFVYEKNTSEYKVADLPIHNASFKVTYNNVDKYARATAPKFHSKYVLQQVC